MSDRVVFEKGFQKKFLEYVQKQSKLNWTQLAKSLELNKGTLKSYRYESCSLPFDFFAKIIDNFRLCADEVFKQYKAKKAKKFAVNNFKNPLGLIKLKCIDVKIPFTNTDPSLITDFINFSKPDFERSIILPTKITPLLAEEVGMSLGDGFISSKKYEYRLKGNKNEKDYYDDYILPMFKQLYNINLRLKDYERCYGFELKSKAIWGFKTKVVGLPAGEKRDIRVPEKLMLADQDILCALVRGYFDTDGCIVFQTKYGYNKYYPIISASSISKPLIYDFKNILTALGFNVKVCYTKSERRYSIYLRGYENFKRYYKMIGWSNPKQRRKVEEWVKTYPNICEKIGFKTDLNKQCGGINNG